ncbi:unnamed protein product [Bursaphelenchus xylophilus]|uniref:(pine wood nematode) hypothetical protein n=1 Tax=Bursaphelenchus xylophilus TaxID=6326 RepID=A0A7I8WJX0_BURXY|nr:unnamed protein product [Bursaphelenchus xylophilus]CAG9107654.1 unnamed protein product [Bursaphelenchus xylophilus]
MANMELGLQNNEFTNIWNALKEHDLSAEKEEASESLKLAKTGRKLQRLLCTPQRIQKRFRGREFSAQKHFIVAVSKIKYSEGNEIHWLLLKRIYQEVMVTDDEPARYGKHWEKVGFQGEDPATDLRGAGLFGLCQLFYLVTEGIDKERLQRLKDFANEENNGFPLAVVGINFTFLLLNRLRKGGFDGLNSDPLPYLNRLYRASFIEFERFWSEKKRSIADFGQILAQVKNGIKKPRRFLETRE